MMRRFLKDHSIQTTSKLIKDTSDGSSTTILDEEALMAGPEVAAAYSEIAKDFVGYTTLIIGGTYCVCKIIERICR